jgi:hypothetical protein
MEQSVEDVAQRNEYQTGAEQREQQSHLAPPHLFTILATYGLR